MWIKNLKLLAIPLLVLFILFDTSCQDRKETVNYKKYNYISQHEIRDLETGQDFKDKLPRNIILLIGDGMGTSQIFAGLVANKGKLYINYFPVTGFQITRSADDLITDSAAGATAMATGEKTYNGMIAVRPDGRQVETILEKAEKRNLKTGLVATSTITHATPAAFIAHNTSRANYEAIASDFLKTDIDVFIGGGRNHFMDRFDKVNLLVELAENGYNIVETMEEIAQFQGDKLAGLVYPDAPPTIIEGRGEMLLQSSQKALEIVSTSNTGFFLMIEGSQIDWGNHQNDVFYQTEEMLDFDKTIGMVLDFAIQDGETLVIVTADHETGGLAISGGSIRNGKVKADYTTTSHTGVMVPVFAYGPKAELFSGIYDNTSIHDKMIEALGWDIK